MMETVTAKVDERGVATITLNRPEKCNAFDEQMITELTDALETSGNNPKTRIVILTAAGKTFSAGADLDWMKRMGRYSYDENLADAKLLSRLPKVLYELPIPTIANVQGPAFGGALGLISCCDIAVATTSTTFCFSEAKIGLIPATISPYIIQAIGIRQAQRYFLSAETINSHQALALGLIHEVVDKIELDSTIEGITQSLLSNSPAAMCAIKNLIQNIGHRPIDDETRLETCKRLAEIRVSDEGQEGLSAFLEKRHPDWQGKN